MQPRDKQGRFGQAGKEPRGEPIALRLPQSLDQQLRATVGWVSADDNPRLRAWIEQAIVEKLNREAKETTA